MEVVAQWMDDLEDMIFALALAWERLRVSCLYVGLVSALILAAQQGFRVLIEWSPTFAAAAGASVGVWAFGLIATEVAWRRHGLARTNPPSTP